jgi:hypothetical protein
MVIRIIPPEYQNEVSLIQIKAYLVEMPHRIAHICQDRNTNEQEKDSIKKKKNDFFAKRTLTCNGNNEYKIIPINRPHEAPIKRLGIKRPELTTTPYVQQVKIK